MRIECEIFEGFAEGEPPGASRCGASPPTDTHRLCPALPLFPNQPDHNQTSEMRDPNHFFFTQTIFPTSKKMKFTTNISAPTRTTFFRPENNRVQHQAGRTGLLDAAQVPQQTHTAYLQHFHYVQTTRITTRHPKCGTQIIFSTPKAFFQRRKK